MKSSSCIQLDGLTGGGQMLRTALSLAMITGQSFRMTRIRGQRSKPGLMRQHLTCVNAACEISAGSADGAEIGATELTFRPERIQAGDYHFSIGTAGSTGLLFQTLLPALFHAAGPSTLRLEGGTHNPSAPPFEFLDQVFLPALRRMGATAALHLGQSGFAPAGGGQISATITPCGRFTPCEFRERGELQAVRIRVPIRNLNPAIASRMLAAATAKFPTADAMVEPREPGPGRGVCCLITTVFDHATELTSAFGEQGVTAERVGQRAAKVMLDFIGTGATVGRCLADQLLLPMALAGAGSFITMTPDAHVPTNISVIERFLPVKFRVEPLSHGCYLIAL